MNDDKRFDLPQEHPLEQIIPLTDRLNFTLGIGVENKLDPPGEYTPFIGFELKLGETSRQVPVREYRGFKVGDSVMVTEDYVKTMRLNQILKGAFLDLNRSYRIAELFVQKDEAGNEMGPDPAIAKLDVGEHVNLYWLRKDDSAK
jgi:hypothetical protein